MQTYADGKHVYSVDKARRLILKSASELAYISHISHQSTVGVPQRDTAVIFNFVSFSGAKAFS